MIENREVEYFSETYTFSTTASLKLADSELPDFELPGFDKLLGNDSFGALLGGKESWGLDIQNNFEDVYQPAVELQPHSPLKEAWHQSQYQKQEQSQCSTTALWASANPVSRMMPTPGGQVLSEADVPPRPRKLKRSLYHSAFYSASKKPFNNAVRHFGVPSEDAYEASFLPDPQPKEENIFERLQNTPTMHTTNYYTQISIAPIIREDMTQKGEGYFLMDLRLSNTKDSNHVDLAKHMYKMYHPSTVTTGQPEFNCQQKSSGRHSSDGEEEEYKPRTSDKKRRNTRQTSAIIKKSEPSAADDDAETESDDQTSDSLTVQVVYVIVKHPRRDGPAQSYQTRGPFNKSSTCINMPNHPGDFWVYDICCCVAGADNQPIWVKSCDVTITK